MDKSDYQNVKNIKDERIQKIVSRIEADGGVLLYVFLRGSHCQGTDTETSDEDYGMIYAANINNLLDLGFKYVDEYKDERNDVYCQEVKKYSSLVIKSNPSVLETLFVDDEFVLYEHPVMTELRKNRDAFISKQCFKPFFGYAISQIEKGTSQEKMVSKPIIQRKTPLDFCFTTYKQGSTAVGNWLEYRGLNQKYCGLVAINNMQSYYGCYYDWANFFKYENITLDDLLEALHDGTVYDTIAIVREMKEAREAGLPSADEWEAMIRKAQRKNMVDFILEKYHLQVTDPDVDDIEQDILFTSWFNAQKPIGYCGIINEKGDSNEVRFYEVVEHAQKDDKSVVLCSVPKDAVSIMHLYFNKDGYSTHCREFKEQQEWIQKRNPDRFRQNIENLKKRTDAKDKAGFYDSKNLAACYRMIQNSIEIARDGKYIVNRRDIDRDYILKIKRGELSYNEIMEVVNKKKEEMKQCQETSTIRETVDQEFLNQWLLNLRLKQIKGEL